MMSLKLKMEVSWSALATERLTQDVFDNLVVLAPAATRSLIFYSKRNNLMRKLSVTWCLSVAQLQFCLNISSVVVAETCEM